jgi:hypothetical protein
MTLTQHDADYLRDRFDDAAAVSPSLMAERTLEYVDGTFDGDDRERIFGSGQLV